MSLANKDSIVVRRWLAGTGTKGNQRLPPFALLAVSKTLMTDKPGRLRLRKIFTRPSTPLTNGKGERLELAT